MYIKGGISQLLRTLRLLFFSVSRACLFGSVHVKRYLCIEDYNYRYTVIRSEAICSLVSRKSILLQTILRNRKKEGIFF